MIKTKIEMSESVIKYPYLGTITNQHGSTVVLFTEPSTGVVVHSTNDLIPIGQYADPWGEGDLFKPFHGKVILENE